MTINQYDQPVNVGMVTKQVHSDIPKQIKMTTGWIVSANSQQRTEFDMRLGQLMTSYKPSFGLSVSTLHRSSQGGQEVVTNFAVCGSSVGLVSEGLYLV